MAQLNLRAAADAVARHPRHAADLGADFEEAATWRGAAEDMVVPWDDALGVHPQSEGFTEHEAWDFEATRPDEYPLLMHFPYFELYRKQVVKQADLVLALHARGDAFSDEEKARDFAYYEAVTVRDSSLSACTQAVIALRSGISSSRTTTSRRRRSSISTTSRATCITASTSPRSPVRGRRPLRASAACATTAARSHSRRASRPGSVGLRSG